MDVSANDFIEIRCPKCGKLIFRVKIGTVGMIEFYCMRCHKTYQQPLKQ